MPLINRLDISGQLVGQNLVDPGKLSVNNPITGNSHLPTVLDRTAIHYDTTENWNSKPLLIGKKSNIYVYSDYKVEEIDGETVYIPAIKIGDGNSYLIDMPFATTSDNGLMSATDKGKLNRIAGSYNANTETITFTLS